MKKLRIGFADQYQGFHPENNEFLNLIRDRYEIEVTDHPDYLIYSVFGNDHLNYDCVRIFYTGECYTPNFNECDYAIGFDRLELGDRYIRVPNYEFTIYQANYRKILERKPFTQADLNRKTSFCSFVVSNLFGQKERSEFFDLLSTYKKVDSGGRFRNNIGGAVKDKETFAASHKFAITFENSCYAGYTTEKIVDAFAAYTIPIYFGDPEVGRDFNEKAFISCRNYGSFEEVVKRVEEIDQNDDLYLQMINENPLLHHDDLDAFRNFLIHIFDQDYEKAFRRPHSMYTEAEAKEKLRHRFFEQNIYKYYKKGKNQIERMKTGTIMTSRRKK